MYWYVVVCHIIPFTINNVKKMRYTHFIIMSENDDRNKYVRVNGSR